MAEDRRIRELKQKFSQDWEIYQIVTHPLKLATLHQLDTQYGTVGLYNLLEIIDAYDLTQQVTREVAEKESKSSQR